MTSQRLEVVQGDITKQSVDAIVNAANTMLVAGGGVCGAIHRAAGPALARECSRRGSCPTGDAVVTRGYDLPATYVIHAVAPVWGGGKMGEAKLLRSCYSACLKLAGEMRLQSLALPSLGTGIYGYPIAEAAVIVVETVRSQQPLYPELELVRFICFSASDLAVYQRLLSGRD